MGWIEWLAAGVVGLLCWWWISYRKGNLRFWQLVAKKRQKARLIRPVPGTSSTRCHLPDTRDDSAGYKRTLCL
jgi:hypothetical protein